MKTLGIAVFAAAILAACASTGWPTEAGISAVSGTLDHFLVVDTATGTLKEPTGPACRSPIADPGDGTRLTLVRSDNGFGDYRPATLRYGLAGSQLLRINCSDGRPVGATPGPR